MPKLHHLLLWTSIASAGLPATPLVADIRFLAPTEYVDSSHPKIVSTARRITAGAESDRDRAVAIHDFVRDEIRFGWAPTFYDQKASQLLSTGLGFCNTKSTLFVALLRAVGIPARQHFVDINSQILSGLIEPGTAFVDHSFAEVLIEGRWIRVDSYIVDKQLAERARQRLIREGKTIGYGAHVNGVSRWDGTEDAFAQFVDDGSKPQLTTHDHGVFQDVGAFYASGRGLNRLNPGLRLLFGFFSRAANRRIEGIRDERN